MDEPPKVLIIGDSISMGYFPHAAAAAGERLELLRHDGNGGDSANVLAQLDQWLAQFPNAALVHLNCGLHDIKLFPPGGEHQVPIDAYRENLRTIFERVRAAGRKAVWATTTPVIDKHHAAAKDFDRHEADVLAYNAAAAEIASSAGAGIDDLHAVVERAGLVKCLAADGVHMSDAGYRALGRAVAAACLPVT